MPSTSISSDRVLIFAPSGRDGVLGLRVLEKVGVRGQLCSSASELCQSMAEGAGAVVLAEEAVTVATLRSMTATLEKQEPWSDLPIVVLTAKVAGPGHQRALDTLRPLGNVTLVDRPVGVRAFQSTVQAAIRSRKRQYDVRRLLDEREELVEQLQQTVRLNEMFVGILSHDLRNPLSAILTGVQHLLRREQTDTFHRPLTRILRSGERMARMIEQLLDFTRARIGGGLPINCTKVSLELLARQVVEELELSSPDRIVWIERNGDSVGEWDGDRLSQVLSNLVGNAVLHGAPEAAVFIEVDGSHPLAVNLRISNKGSIRPALLPTMFDAFRGGMNHTEGRQGLGLGLYITRQIVLAHRGTIEVTSSEDEGTTFFVRLPRAAAQSADAVSNRMGSAASGPFVFDTNEPRETQTR